jgi:hypothetical protein
VAYELNTTYLPYDDISDEPVLMFPAVPSVATDTRVISPVFRGVGVIVGVGVKTGNAVEFGKYATNGRNTLLPAALTNTPAINASRNRTK